MSSEINNLLKHGSIYTIGEILGKAIAFIMIPVYTNYLHPSEYGILEILSLTADIISTILGIGMTTAVMRYYSKYEDRKSKDQVISTTLIGSLIIMTFVSVLCLMFSTEFSIFLFSSAQFDQYFRIVFITMLLQGGIQIPLVFIRARLKSKTFIIINLIKLIIQLSLNIYFLVILRMGVIGILYSNLIASAIISAFLTFTTFKKVGIQFSLEKFKEVLRFGSPLLIADLSVFLLTYSDRYFLNHFCDLTSVGLYSMAYKFGMLVSVLFTSPFRAIWGVRLYEIAKQDDAAKMFSKIMIYFLAGSMGVALGISFLTKDFLRIVANKAYWDAYKLVPIICTAYIIAGIIAISGAGLLIKNKTKYKALSTTTAVVINIILNFILIPRWGAGGAAISTLVSFLVRMLIDAFYSQRFFHINYDAKKIFKISIIYIVSVFTAQFINIESEFISIITSFLIYLIYPVLIVLTGIITSDERRRAVFFIKKRFKL